MKPFLVIGAILAIQNASAKLHSHDRLAAIDRRHHHHHHRSVNHQALPSPAEGHIEERQLGTCKFPTNLGLQYVQGDATGDLNAGWAMSGDHPCSVGTWCQYSCPSGTLMTSWNPAIPNYPSADGGVFCGPTGIVLPDGPLCKEGATNIQAVDASGKGASFCQTVTPGNEAQLIATWVPANGQTTLAIPKPDYFSQISAHYYINPPGVSTDNACRWGDTSAPVGNWAPLVGGGHQTSDGRTWIDLGLNPKYKDDFSSKPIKFKVEIICDGECNNPCAYDPSQHGLLEMVGSEGTAWTLGDDGAPFCTTVVTSGSASYKVSMLDGSDPSSNSDIGSGSGSGSESAPAPPSSSAAAESSSSSSSSSSTSEASSSSKSQSSSTTPISSSVSSSSSTSAASSSADPISTSSANNSTLTATGSQATWSPHILLQSSATSATTGGTSSGITPTTSISSPSGVSGATTSSSSSTSFGVNSYTIPSLASLALSGAAMLILL
ncbi:MAG: hypothetical protein GOMPHAMPRED_004150 [Gomphillus americanus]|uniref:Uncharacterized protein n=1 Tax=Gomphillus americanus TaxID=1940652 RepID=A0A8H3FNB3_9LECA|nr:MAG: hypothetical protein GOMPHAMPRED_004150 [Gomphillus americanus]